LQLGRFLKSTPFYFLTLEMVDNLDPNDDAVQQAIRQAAEQKANSARRYLPFPHSQAKWVVAGIVTLLALVILNPFFVMGLGGALVYGNEGSFVAGIWGAFFILLVLYLLIVRAIML